MGLETEIQKDILNLLPKYGFMVWRNHTQAVRVRGGTRTKNPNAGAPDIFALKDGLLYCIEVKTPQGKLSLDQKRWLQRAFDYGALTFVTTSFHDLLERLGLLDKDPV